MTQNANGISLKKSKRFTELNGVKFPNLPSADKLVEGELAINYAEGLETISTKNESGNVVTFSSDNYYTEQKLGSGFTGSNSAKTVTDIIVENEETVSAALNDLKDTKCDLSAETKHYNELNSGLTIVATAVGVINDKLSGKTDTSAFTEHTGNTSLHFSGSEKENLDALATNIAAISGITADKIDSWNAAAGQDLTQYYKKTETSGKTELETAFNGKANTSDIPSVSGYADSVKYNSTSKYVEFYHGTTAGTKVFEYDASPFLIDGMVQDVKITGVTSGDVTVTCLVISFNTDAGKQDINIPLTEIFDPSNYYTKSETSGATELSTAFNNKLSVSDFNTYSGTVDTLIGNKASQSDLNTLSGTVTAHTADTSIHFTTGDVKTQIDNSISGKADTTAVTQSIEAAVSGKTDVSAFTAHTASTTVHVTSEEKTTWNNKSNFSGSYNDLTDKPTLFSGDYNDLENKPTIPSKTSDLTNDSDFATSGYVQTVTSDMATKTWVGEQNYLTSADISGKQDVSGMTAYTTTAITNTLSGTVTAHTADTTIHVTASDKSKWNNVDNKLNTSDFNTYSGAVDTAIGNKAEQSDLSTLSGTVTGHTADSTIHVTSSDKSTWNAKVDSSDIANFFDDAKYEDSGTSKVINFYHGNTIKATIDADDFIKDGMISGVTLESKSGTTYLVINWNTDAGIETTELNIGDIFEADNYYTKSETSGKTEISTALGTKVNSATFTAHTADTSAHFSGDEKENLDSLATNIAAISGITSTKVSNWDGAATDSHTHSNKSVLDGISSTDITNWNSKTSNVGTVTSVQIGLPTGLSAATTAITESGKFDVKFSDGYSIPTTLKQGQWDEAYTAKHSHSNKSNLDSITGNVGTMAYQNATSYSSATEVQTALGKKSDTGHTHVKADITDFPAINDGTFTISGNGASVVSTSANASANKGLNIKSSTNVTITTGASEITIAATDTTYTAGSFVTITGSNNSINVTTGTTSSSVSRGDHNHDAVYTKITDSEAMEQTLAAAITDIDSRAADKEELKALVNDYQDFKLMYENRRERKRFTNRDDFVARLKMAAADQNLERYGLKVGDYYTTTNGGKTYNYVIAGLNTMKGTSTPYRLSTDHVGIIVDTNDTHAWNTAGNTYTSQNSYSTGGTWTTGSSAAGYANCDLHYYLTNTVLPNVKTNLGSGNIKNHYKLYSTAVNTRGYNRFGDASGCASSWAWYVNQEICALSEVQVYGSTVWSSSGYDTGEACRQLDVFRVYNMNEIFEGRYPWLRDVASASSACNVGDFGSAYAGAASNACSVAALILFA